MNRAESEQSRITVHKTSHRTLQRLRYLGLIIAIAVVKAFLDLVLGGGDSAAKHYFDIYFLWFTVIFGVLAAWLLIRDWALTRGQAFMFDGERETFTWQEGGRERFQLSFGAIKRIKVQESSNLFPVYMLSVHLRDGQIIEIDASAKRGEIYALADQLAAMSGAEIVTQLHDEPLSKEEQEEQRRRAGETYTGD